MSNNTREKQQPNSIGLVKFSKSGVRIGVRVGVKIEKGSKGEELSSIIKNDECAPSTTFDAAPSGKRDKQYIGCPPHELGGLELCGVE